MKVHNPQAEEILDKDSSMPNFYYACYWQESEEFLIYLSESEFVGDQFPNMRFNSGVRRIITNSWTPQPDFVILLYPRADQEFLDKGCHEVVGKVIKDQKGEVGREVVVVYHIKINSWPNSNGSNLAFDPILHHLEETDN